jgi:hypothetical protein
MFCYNFKLGFPLIGTRIFFPATSSHRIAVPTPQTMAGGDIPSLHTLQAPEKFQDVLRKDRGDDCLSCKVIG